MGNKRTTFGTRLKELRKKAGYTTQDKFSQDFGRSLDTIQNWEQDKKYPPMKTFLELCDFLKCDADYLAGRIEQKTHDLTFLCAETGLSPEAIQALAEIKSGPLGGDDLDIVSKILTSPKLSDAIKSVKDARFAQNEVKDSASSAFGKNVDSWDRERALEDLPERLRSLRASRFEVAEAAAGILNDCIQIDDTIRKTQEQIDRFVLEESEKDGGQQ